VGRRTQLPWPRHPRQEPTAGFLTRLRIGEFQRSPAEIPCPARTRHRSSFSTRRNPTAAYFHRQP
jgi:hypothetical protein